MFGYDLLHSPAMDRGVLQYHRTVPQHELRGFSPQKTCANEGDQEARKSETMNTKYIKMGSRDIK